ncbi:EF-hand domain-containing protein [Segnochrobactrum spirostomi]|uniref:EF-hand domain-containing protein n=1 Tax=Segnochrobactrum spirostomi TaxID=2608987 RepID=A0A6A7Y529_9HYPH|nr:EF-hand domain-containing protein [Segnochrobactrum spirostomi]MQT13457.1 hypothetical protein [Segnochrobactrum spirostomi]
MGASFRSWIVVVLAAFACGAGVAWADAVWAGAPGDEPGQAGGPRAAETAIFFTLDTDGDGIVTKREAWLAQAAVFDALDQNRDGSLDGAELDAVARARHPDFTDARRAVWIAAILRDGDGRRVTRAQYAGRLWWFRRADLDHDNRVTLAEVRVMPPASLARATTLHGRIPPPPLAPGAGP